MGSSSAGARWWRVSLPARVLAATALFCVLLVGFDAWRTWQQRRAVIADDQMATANLARSLAQHAHDTVKTADAAVMALRDAVETDGLTPRVLARLSHLSAMEVEDTPSVHGLYVFDANGTYVVSPRPLPSPAPSAADRPYFQHHRTHRGRDVLIGPPVRSKLDGSWIVTVSRRIDTPGGGFGGVALATLSVDALQAFYGSFDLGAHGAISLQTADSRLIARIPADPARIGADLSHGQLATQFLGQGRTGSFAYVSAVDGVHRLGSFRFVEGYPLLMVVAHGYADVMNPWWIDALTHAAVCLAAATIVALMGLRLAARVREGQRQAAAVARSEEHYRLLADYSTDVITQLDPDLRRVYISPACQTMLGYDPRELIGRHCTDMLSAEDQAVFAASLTIARSVGQAPPATYKVRHKDGTPIWVETIGRSMPDGRGYVMATREVTQRLVAEEQLQEATGALNRMMAEAYPPPAFREPPAPAPREDAATGPS